MFERGGMIEEKRDEETCGIPIESWRGRAKMMIRRMVDIVLSLGGCRACRQHGIMMTGVRGNCEQQNYEIRT